MTYVDDIITAGVDLAESRNFKKCLSRVFEVTDLGGIELSVETFW